jgi:hypothetical protein
MGSPFLLSSRFSLNDSGRFHGVTITQRDILPPEKLVFARF